MNVLVWIHTCSFCLLCKLAAFILALWPKQFELRNIYTNRQRGARVNIFVKVRCGGGWQALLAASAAGPMHAHAIDLARSLPTCYILPAGTRPALHTHTVPLLHHQDHEGLLH